VLRGNIKLNRRRIKTAQCAVFSSRFVTDNHLIRHAPEGRPFYTGEDLKWLSEAEPHRGVISNRYRYRAIGELKWDILILLWCKCSSVYINKRFCSTNILEYPIVSYVFKNTYKIFPTCRNRTSDNLITFSQSYEHLQSNALPTELFIKCTNIL
jgi:hypothetical protein